MHNGAPKMGRRFLHIRLVLCPVKQPANTNLIEKQNPGIRNRCREIHYLW